VPLKEKRSVNWSGGVMSNYLYIIRIVSPFSQGF